LTLDDGEPELVFAASPHYKVPIFILSVFLLLHELNLIVEKAADGGIINLGPYCGGCITSFNKIIFEVFRRLWIENHSCNLGSPFAVVFEVILKTPMSSFFLVFVDEKIDARIVPLRSFGQALGAEHRQV